MDRALQRMSPSTQTYTLFTKERYEAYRAQVNRDLKAFIDQMGYTEAQPLVEYLENRPPPTFASQHISLVALKSLVAQLEREEPQILQRLRAIVSVHSDIALSNPNYRAA